MNIIYLTFIDIEEPSMFGVNKKILGQVRAFEKKFNCCYYTNVNKCKLDIYEKDKIVKSINSSRFFIRKIGARMSYYNELLEFFKEKDVKVVYIRYRRTDFFFNQFLKNCNKLGLKVLIEIPTYPYDQSISKLTYVVDSFFRKRLHKYTDRIVTFSKHNLIFNIKTININNGIDLDSIELRKCISKKPNKINLIGVANLSIWHGYDRLLKGLNDYYNNEKKHDIEVYFQIIGEGPEFKNLESLIKSNHLGKYVKLKGFKSGADLDDEFNKADVGVVSLGIHRIGLDTVSTLKSKEYWARGLPLIKSYNDDQLDNNISEFIQNFEANESNININEIVRFYNTFSSIDGYKTKMRDLANKEVSWDTQLKSVIDYIRL